MALLVLQECCLTTRQKYVPTEALQSLVFVHLYVCKRCAKGPLHCNL
jgi:hypothetical protein